MNGGAAGRYLILGFPRSGTTLLSRLLGAHGDISSPPESHLFSASGRYLAELTDVEGPPIGVLTGLGFLGVTPQEVYAPLREMAFAFHERIAAGRPVWVEKTGTDIFHLETLEEMLSGHVRFICLTRHAMDVVASNMDLAATMGSQLPELFAMTRGVNSPHEGIARAWADRAEALHAFAARQGDAAISLTYEGLLEDPENELARLMAFIGLESDVTEQIERAFAEPAEAIGLGDFRIHETRGLRPPEKNGWRKRIPPAAISRIAPIVGPAMEAWGYKTPKGPRQPDRETAIRQFVLASQFKSNTRSQE